MLKLYFEKLYIYAPIEDVIRSLNQTFNKKYILHPNFRLKNGEHVKNIPVISSIPDIEYAVVDEYGINYRSLSRTNNVPFIIESSNNTDYIEPLLKFNNSIVLKTDSYDISGIISPSYRTVINELHSFDEKNPEDIEKLKKLLQKLFGVPVKDIFISDAAGYDIKTIDDVVQIKTNGYKLKSRYFAVNNGNYIVVDNEKGAAYVLKK